MIIDKKLSKHAGTSNNTWYQVFPNMKLLKICLLILKFELQRIFCCLLKTEKATGLMSVLVGDHSQYQIFIT